MGVLYDIGAYTFEQAVHNGHLHIIQWLREQDPPCKWSVTAYVRAARKGHLHIIQWLRKQDPPCPWDPQLPQEDTDALQEDPDAFSAAASSEHLHIMRWLYENGFPWKQWSGTQYMQVAASKGDLEALDWARSQHPPFAINETVCEANLWWVSFSAVAVLRWLRTQDPPCPWDNSTRHYAQRATFIKVHLTQCGLAGDVAVMSTNIVSDIEEL